MFVLLGGLAAAVLSGAFTYLMCTACRRWLSLDVPNARSLHASPTPRGAGLAIVASSLGVGAAVVIVMGLPVGTYWAVAGAMGVATISWLDDRRPLPPGRRLIVHVGAATIFVIGATEALRGAQPAGAGAVAEAGLLSTIVLVVAIAWSTNLYNFMDGMDGFAGGMTVVGFGACAAVAGQNNQLAFAALFAVISGAAAGFLVFNLPPARIFMGDVGASTLGFLGASLGLLAIWHRALSVPALLLVFSPFIVDSSVTLLRRLLAGEPVWKPHRTHFYQRLASGRCGVRRTLAAEYIVMVTSALTAFSAEFWNLDWIVVWGAWGVIYAALIAWITQLERWQPQEKAVGASLV